MKNNFNIKVVDNKEILSQDLDLKDVLKVAKDIFDNKEIFIKVSPKLKENPEFWGSDLVNKLSELNNVYFTDNDFFKTLTVDKAIDVVEIIEKTREEGKTKPGQKIFLTEEQEKENSSNKDKQEKLKPSEENTNTFTNIDNDNFENEVEDIINDNLEQIELDFSQANSEKNIQEVLEQEDVYSNLDREDKRDFEYTKEEFLKKMKHFEELNYNIYQLLLKTFETINGMQNYDGYFNIPVSIVPRPQGEKGIFDSNVGNYFYTVIDNNGMAIYQDSIEIGKTLLESVEIYKSLGYMILILTNGYNHIDHIPADKLCETLDIPLYFKKENGRFYKKYVDKMY